jgi:hypothetical protein
MTIENQTVWKLGTRTVLVRDDNGTFILMPWTGCSFSDLVDIQNIVSDAVRRFAAPRFEAPPKEGK